MPETVIRTSADDAVERFDTPTAAAKYARALNDTPTHRREMRCILRGLRNLPAGAKVLDLPSGTGRLLPELTARGFVVTEADVSPHMLDQARLYAAARGVSIAEARFVVASVFDTGFSEGEFDATVCNRLFHHFHEADVRRKALRELRRVTRGPVIASFFSVLSFDGTVFRVRDMLRSKRATDRVPIMPGVFSADARAAGLRVTSWLSTRPGISKQWYAVLERE